MLPMNAAPQPNNEDAPIVCGKYRLGRQLGAGGMGTVYVAEHLALGEPVALKVLRSEYARTPEIVERFLREARSLFRINSENVVRVLDVEAPEHMPPFLVMEYVEGQSLDAILERRRYLEVDEAVELVRQTCVGLGEAHKLGIVHRDVKPHNVMVTTRLDGSACVKLVDFGIAQMGVGISGLSEGKSFATRLTMTDAIIGTPCYMAPEQLRSARAADARSDVWSVGVLLFELLTGERPWDAASPGDLVFRQHTEEVPLAAFGRDIPREIAAIVLRCLALDPANRWQDANELHDALAAYARPVAASALVDVTFPTRPGRNTPKPPPIRTPSSSPPLRAITPFQAQNSELTFARQKMRTTHGGTAFERHLLVPRGRAGVVTEVRERGAADADRAQRSEHPRKSVPVAFVRGENTHASSSPILQSVHFALTDVLEQLRCLGGELRLTDRQTFLAVVLGVGGIVFALALLLVVAATRGDGSSSAKSDARAATQQTTTSASAPAPSTGGLGAQAESSRESTVVVVAPKPKVVVVAPSASASAAPTNNVSPSEVVTTTNKPVTAATPSASASARPRKPKSDGSAIGNPSSLYNDKW